MWACYALLSAFGMASSDACMKAALARGTDLGRVAFLRHLIAVPVLLPLLALGIPALSRTFWLTHVAWLPLETAALYLYLHALRVSPLSLTLPFLALTPLFLVLTGWLFLGERVSPLGLAGIVLVVLGSYVIHGGGTRGHAWEPFRAMFRERGTRWMILVAFLYSLTSLCGKVLVRESSATYFAAHFAVVMLFITAPLGLRRTTRAAPPPPLRPTLAGGLFYGLMILGHTLALETAVVAYMISIKRLSGAFGVVYGRVFFREPHLAPRLAGCLLMITGDLLILLG